MESVGRIALELNVQEILAVEDTELRQFAQLCCYEIFVPAEGPAVFLQDFLLM